MAKRFILVHGAWHGAWCWDRVATLLREGGHEVVAPNLPGHGADASRGDGVKSSPSRVSLRSYATFLAELLQRGDGEAILIGHSMGGMAITAAAQLAPERISALVYLAAFLPRGGDSVFSLMDEHRAAAGPSPVEALMRLTPDRRCYDIDRAGAAEVFYNGCEPAEAARAAGLLTPQPLLPLSGRLEPGDAAEHIRRIYISCRNDRVIPPAHQHQMAERSDCDDRLELDTGHSPFLERPEELAEIFVSLPVGKE